MRRGIRACRSFVLFAAFLGAFVLHSWSLEGDPKFYAFLKTDIGKAMGTWFGWWGSPLEVPISDKPLHKLSANERAVLHELRDVSVSERIVVQPSYRDIRFRTDFAAMGVYIEPPFMVISDMNTSSVELLFGELHALHRDFLRDFAGLIQRTPGEQLIHVLLFDRPESYHDYEQLCRGDSGETAGFYSPTADRLVLYNPLPSSGAEIQPGSRLPDALRITLRHEGGHQLCFAFGIHSEHRIENDWLVEGLASYCEESQIGDVSNENLNTLRRAMMAEEVIPLTDLINLRSHRGLLAHRKSALAYAESWSLVHLLLQPKHRANFEGYISFVRDPGNFHQLRFRQRSEVLCQFLGMTQAELDAVWLDHARALTDHQPQL